MWRTVLCNDLRRRFHTDEVGPLRNKKERLDGDFREYHPHERRSRATTSISGVSERVSHFAQRPPPSYIPSYNGAAERELEYLRRKRRRY